MIVDEADKLFEEGQKGFRDQVIFFFKIFKDLLIRSKFLFKQLGAIYKACDNPKVKHAFFSATFTNEVENWCKMNLNNLVQVSIGRK